MSETLRRDFPTLESEFGTLREGFAIHIIANPCKKIFTNKTQTMKKLLCIVFICLFGCMNKDFVIYKNKSFKDIHSLAEINKSPFCIILIDSMGDLSKEYIFQLEKNYKHLFDKAVFNITDINHIENEWYVKWLSPVSIPLTCVFSSDGRLVDLIPGVSKETFLYTEEAITKVESTDFHWPNRFKTNKKNVLPLLDNLLQQKRYIDEGLYSPLELNQLADSLNYPYSSYLKLLGELMERDTIGAQQTAQSLIELETPASLELYKDEFITAKKVLNPNFDVSKEPNIRVDSTNIYLTNCKQDVKMPFEVLVYNDGDKPLKISKIHTSCSCVEQHKYNEDIVIKSKGSFPVKFYFTPDRKGKILRDIFITSNAINMSILHITVLADV